MLPFCPHVGPRSGKVYVATSNFLPTTPVGPYRESKVHRWGLGGGSLVRSTMMFISFYSVPVLHSLLLGWWGVMGALSSTPVVAVGLPIVNSKVQVEGQPGTRFMSVVHKEV